MTSADFGYSVGKFIAYAYVPVEYAEKGTRLQVRYFDQVWEAVVSDDPQVDPKMERLRS